MNDTLHLGPLAIPMVYLLLVATFLAADRAGRFVARRGGQPGVDRPVLHGLLLGLLCSRLWFVWQMRAVYAASPLDILDIRDGGWEPQAGFLAAWVYGLVRMRAATALRRPLLAALGVASAAWILGSLLLLATARPAPGLPALSLQSGDGAIASPEAFRGKPVVVNLWATWCPPCQREMPVLQRAQASMPEIHFIFLNQGESSGTIDAFLARRHPGLRNVYLDTASRAGARFGDNALPTTLFFDARGVLVDRRVGELSQATLRHHLDRLAAAGRP